MPEAELEHDKARAILENYAEPLLRNVAAALIKPRTTLAVEELAERILATLQNPPVVDRRIRELSPHAQCILTLMGMSRQPCWKIGHLLQAAAAAGRTDGLLCLRELFSHAFLFPNRPGTTVLENFEVWLTQPELLQAEVFTISTVAARSRLGWENLPDLGEVPPASQSPLQADGLEWRLRQAVAQQMVAEASMRQTQAGALFKRDLTRIRASEILAAAPADQQVPLPDSGVLALHWCTAIGWLTLEEDELRTTRNIPAQDRLWDMLTQQLAGLFRVETWDPLLGAVTVEPGTTTVWPSTLACLLMLFGQSSGPISTQALANWLWEHHPSWQAVLPKESHATKGEAWVRVAALGVLYQLRLVEVWPQEPPLLQLTELGRHIVKGEPVPAAPPEFPQALLVQPNAEVLAFRQALTPQLIQKLTLFAKWKALGAACTLELTPEQTYLGLENGLNLAGILQTLNQYSSRPVPPAMNDLLNRWANKRERISLYTSATLVEFSTAADLDQAIARGVVAIRVTDRIGVCSDGADPDFKNLRLTGNRDYDLRPARCLRVADDGVTFHVDAGASDLLFEAEVVQLADALPDDSAGHRSFRASPESLARAAQAGWKLDTLNQWFLERSGSILPPACQLFLLASSAEPLSYRQRLVVDLPNVEIANGLMQWPESAELIEERLGPVECLVTPRTPALSTG